MDLFYKPLSIRVFCQEGRTQAGNKERAFAILRAKLFEVELARQQAEVYAQRKNQARCAARDTTRGRRCARLLALLSADFKPP